MAAAIIFFVSLGRESFWQEFLYFVRIACSGGNGFWGIRVLREEVYVRSRGICIETEVFILKHKVFCILNARFCFRNAIGNWLCRLLNQNSGCGKDYSPRSEVSAYRRLYADRNCCSANKFVCDGDRRNQRMKAFMLLCWDEGQSGDAFKGNCNLIRRTELIKYANLVGWVLTWQPTLWIPIH